jgi:hypothetical protein
MSKKTMVHDKAKKPAAQRKNEKIGLDADDFDAIDEFAAQRERIGLELEPEQGFSDDGFGEEAVMNIPFYSDDDEDEDGSANLREAARKSSKKDKLAALKSKQAEKTRKSVENISRLAQETSDSENDFLEEEERNHTAGVWGKNRANYYATENEVGDAEAVAEFAQEARRTQKKRLEAMRVDDFMSEAATGIPFRATKHSASKKKVSFDDLSEFLDPQDDSPASETQAAEDSLNEAETADLLNLLRDFKERLTLLKTHLAPLLARAKAHEMESSAGLSFLQCKYHLMLAYCATASYYLVLKSRGVRIAGHPVFKRLIRYRLLLEKLRPLEAKMRFQIDKLLQDSPTNGSNTFRANPEAFAAVTTAEGENGSEEAEDEQNDSGTKAYRAPKLAPVYFPEDDNNSKTERSSDSRLKKAASRSRLIAELRGELDDLPEEESIDPVRMASHAKADHKTVAREAYEEDNFMRFQTTKRELRQQERQSRPLDELDDLDEFFGELDEINAAASGKKGSSSKKRSAASISDYLASINSDQGTEKRSSEKYAGSDESDIEDDTKASSRQDKKRVRRQEKLAAKAAMRGPVSYRPIQDRDASAPRPASYEMIKNRGLTPSRSKEQRNPRVKQRTRYEKAVKKLSSFRGGSLQTNSSKPYIGESTGIRTNLTKSVRFK